MNALLHDITESEFLSMARWAFKTKNAMMRIGANKEQTIAEIAKAMKTDLEEGRAGK